jgi:hypothetical protein
LRTWEAIRTESDLLRLQAEMREKLLQMIGGLPAKKTELHAKITGTIRMNGYSVEKVIFESLPGVYVTALVYAPEDRVEKHPAVLVPAGHAANGKIHYQGLSQRLVQRGYVVNFGIRRLGRAATTWCAVNMRYSETWRIWRERIWRVGKFGTVCAPWIIS